MREKETMGKESEVMLREKKKQKEQKAKSQCLGFFSTLDIEFHISFMIIFFYFFGALHYVSFMIFLYFL